MNAAAPDDRAVHARMALEEVCARGGLERASELYAHDFIDHVNALEFHGQEGIAKSVAMYRALFPDLRIEVVDQITEGDQVVSRWTLTGTHRGRRVTLPGITISRFHDGQIAEDWTVSDNLTLLRQVGLRRGLALAMRYAKRRLPRTRGGVAGRGAGTRRR
jgi:predicted ester cyclase